jgi:hypothetical protein
MEKNVVILGIKEYNQLMEELTQYRNMSKVVKTCGEKYIELQINIEPYSELIGKTLEENPEYERYDSYSRIMSYTLGIKQEKPQESTEKSE